MAQDKPEAVRVFDRDAPAIPVRIPRGDPDAAMVDEPADNAVVDGAIEVEHEQVFLRGRSGSLPEGVGDEFQVPRCIRPAKHDQGVLFARGDIRTVQDLKSQAIRPKTLCHGEVAAGAGKTNMVRCVGQDQRVLPRAGDGVPLTE